MVKFLCLQSSSIFEQYGGIEYYLDDLLTIIASQPGSEIETLVPQRSRPLALADKAYRVTPVQLERGWLFSKIANRYSPRFFRIALARARASRPDYLLCAHASLGPLTAAVSFFTGIPYLTIGYGIEVWDDLRWQDEWALARSHAIVSISHWTKSCLVARGYDPERIAIAQPHLDPRLENQPLRPLGNGALRLLSVSRLDANEKYKGQDHVLCALAELRKSDPALRFEYTIQGEGSDRPRLEGCVQELGLGDCVRFVGRVPDRAQLQELYRHTDLFVLPSRYGRWHGRWRGEGFGIVYLEAAAFGVPSVAYDCGGVTDIIASERDGVLVEPEDIWALARALKALALNRDKIESLGRAAHAKVNTQFTQHAIAAQWKVALEALTTLRPGSAKAFRSPPPDAVPQPSP